MRTTGDNALLRCTSCAGMLKPLSKFCSSCGTPVAGHEDRGSTVSAQPSIRRYALGIFFIVLLVGVATFISFLNPSVHKVIGNQPTVESARNYDSTFVEMVTIEFREHQSDIVFSLDDLKHHRLVRFEYRGGRVPRPVLAYIAPTGQVVTAISVSEHCGSTTFKIKENKIYCAQCPSNWDMMTMEAFGCCAKYFPDPIASRVESNEVHISKATIESWTSRM